MELRQLRYFTKVASERSFSRAAEKLNMRATETVGQLRLLQPRTRTLDGTLHDLFTPLYPAMPANNVQPAPFAAAARAAPRFLLLSLGDVIP